jgi:hypothetical protein
MLLETQASTTSNLINATSAISNKPNHQELAKPVEVSTVKESSLQRLLASCCDCV